MSRRTSGSGGLGLGVDGSVELSDRIRATFALAKCTSASDIIASKDTKPMTPVVDTRTDLLRKARTGDVAAIQRLINGFAERDLMLPRSLSQLYENIRDFYVVEAEGSVFGCAALHVSWKDLGRAEVAGRR